MDGSAVLVTPPAAEPVTLAEAKLWARVDTSYTTDDALITALITAARQHIETIACRALITQTWDYFLDCFPYGGLSPLRWTYGSPFAASVPRWTQAFPSGELALPYPTLQSVTFLKYTDDTGTVQTLDPTLYQVDTARIPGRIVPAYGQVWPTARAQPNAVQVRFQSGFGASGSSVPEPLKDAIKVLVATWYGQRETLAPGTIGTIPAVLDVLINQYRVYWL